MGTPDIPIDEAELLSVLLEAILYGFSVLMFGGTIRILVPQWFTGRTTRKMFAVACALLLFSTVHIVIDIIRIMDGLILYRDTYPGGPIAYFSDVSQWTFVYKNYVFAAQTLIGDGVVLYRCYVVWKSKLIIILPVLLWCAVVVSGIGAPYIASRAGRNGVFGWSLSQWITSFYAMTFITNLLSTLLLAYRIWYVGRRVITRLHPERSQLRHILHIIIDAGMIYSFTLLAQLIACSRQSNAQYVILDVIVPIISITFYMVIIRVRLANQPNQSMNMMDTTYLSTRNTLCVGQQSEMQVDIMTFTEHKIDSCQRLPLTLDPMAGDDVGCAINLDSTEPAV